MIFTSLLGALALLQVPTKCALEKDATQGPFCFAATFTEGLHILAQGKRDSQDSIIAAGTTFDLQRLLTVATYWRLERARLAREFCEDLGSFKWLPTDTAGNALAGEICAPLDRMSRLDSLTLTGQIEDLENPQALSLSQRADRDARFTQQNEALSRLFVVSSLGVTFAITTTDPHDSSHTALDLTREQHRWLLASLRRGAVVGDKGGVFSQTAAQLLSWLQAPEWRFAH